MNKNLFLISFILLASVNFGRILTKNHPKIRIIKGSLSDTERSFLNNEILVNGKTFDGLVMEKEPVTITNDNVVTNFVYVQAVPKNSECMEKIVLADKQQ